MRNKGPCHAAAHPPDYDCDCNCNCCLQHLHIFMRVRSVQTIATAALHRPSRINENPFPNHFSSFPRHPSAKSTYAGRRVCLHCRLGFALFAACCMLHAWRNLAHASAGCMGVGLAGPCSIRHFLGGPMRGGVNQWVRSYMRGQIVLGIGTMYLHIHVPASQDSAGRFGWGRDGDWTPSPTAFPPPSASGAGAGLSGMERTWEQSTWVGFFWARGGCSRGGGG